MFPGSISFSNQGSAAPRANTFSCHPRVNQGPATSFFTPVSNSITSSRQISAYLFCPQLHQLPLTYLFLPLLLFRLRPQLCKKGHLLRVLFIMRQHRRQVVLSIKKTPASSVTLLEFWGDAKFLTPLVMRICLMVTRYTIICLRSKWKIEY